MRIYNQKNAPHYADYITLSPIFSSFAQHYKRVHTLEHGNRQFNIERKMKPAENWSEERQIFSHAYEKCVKPQT